MHAWSALLDSPVGWLLQISLIGPVPLDTTALLERGLKRNSHAQPARTII